MIPNNLTIYNSMSRCKELFEPLHPGRVGMYVCGPTVYGDGHLGHARPAIPFDILFRYLTHLGYKAVSYKHPRSHETKANPVCRLLV